MDATPNAGLYAVAAQKDKVPTSKVARPLGAVFVYENLRFMLDEAQAALETPSVIEQMKGLRRIARLAEETLPLASGLLSPFTLRTRRTT